MPTLLEYDKNLPLYLASGQRFALHDAKACIEAAFAEHKPVLIYLHGRAAGKGEPKRSVLDGTYAALQAYGATVIGFTWDADDTGYDIQRPLAIKTGFVHFLDLLAQYVESRALALPSLIAHSMGNLLIAELAHEGYFSGPTLAQQPRFKHIVLTAPALRSKDHHQWLGQIHAARQVYVTYNQHDRMLLALGVVSFAAMLGKKLVLPLAASAAVQYVDVGNLHVNHHYFVPSGQENKQNLNTFFATVLRGQSVDLATLARPVLLDGVTVFRLING
jgi:Alpha/beta hydrolase of unknown function (DUF900)